jgi:hypothetical protein
LFLIKGHVTIALNTWPGFTFVISNAAQKALLGNTTVFLGTLTSVNNYNKSVVVGCSSGAPNYCSGGSYMPGPTGVPIQVPVSDTTTGTRAFALQASGPDLVGSLKRNVSVNLLTMDFSLAASSGSITVPSGGVSLPLSLQLLPSTNFDAQISFSCANLAAGLSCSFFPAPSVHLTGTATKIQVLLTAAASASLGSGNFVVVATSSDPAGSRNSALIPFTVKAGTTATDVAVKMQQLAPRTGGLFATGANVGFQITNSGSEPAPNVQLSILFDGLETISLTADQGTCNGTGPVNCVLGDLPPGTTVDVDLHARGALGESSISSFVSSDAADLQSGNNAALLKIRVLPRPFFH